MQWANLEGTPRSVWRAVLCKCISDVRRRLEPATQRSIARRLGCSPGTMWGLFIELRDAGFLTWPAHETDQTEKVGVELTKSGEVLAYHAHAIVANAPVAPAPGDFWPMGGAFT